MKSRRGFIKGSAAAGAGLLIGFRIREAGAANATTSFTPNAFVRIAPDNTVTVISKHLEFGQGIYTGLATLVAEELDADFAQIKVVAAPADAARYNNLMWGEIQGTGNSSSMANSRAQMRQAGAAARAMLVQAAAKEWNVPGSEIAVAKGVVSHAPSNRHASFGALASKAAAIPLPQNVPLKDPSKFILIGKPIARVDIPAKVDGSAVYAMDVARPGLLIAVVARPPRFGGKVKSFDATAAKAIAGVTDIVQIQTGVAVLGRDFWAAKRGRDALKIEWDDSAAETRGSAELFAEYRKLLDQPGLVARKSGDAEAALAGAAKVLTADYEFPFLAHTAMEPLNATVELSADRCRIWAGSQIQTIDQAAASIISGIARDKVEVHTTFAGGSFGRRATQNADVVAEAVMVAKAIGARAPVRLIWTREDDIRGGYYRPMYVHRLRAALDKTGRILGWHHRIVGQPLIHNALGNASIDPSMVQGAVSLPYAIANVTVDTQAMTVGVPVQWWRSVGSSHNAYSTETFIDELAVAAGKDPVGYRLALLAQQPRAAGVLRLAVEKAGSGPLPAGRYRGVAVHEWVGTHVAQVAEISLTTDGVKVERVICAVDCGTAINPGIVAAQMESGISYGLGAALHNALTLTKGEVDQSNFHDFKALRIGEMPQVEVHIMQSEGPPTGIGEAAVPPIAPAVANAVFAATGKRVRILPFEGHQI